MFTVRTAEPILVRLSGSTRYDEMRNTIEDIKIALAQVKRRLDMYEHYGMHEDADAARAQLAQLERELEGRGKDEKMDD